MAHAPLPPFAALRAFEAVGRLGGIRRAADELGVTHAIVSRHLRALEQQLRTTLYDREGRRLTTAGKTYHRRLSKAMTELAAATEAVQAGRAGKLVISCAPGLALHWLTARLHRFNTDHRISMVDLRAEDAPPDLSDGEIDGDIRYLADATPLGKVRDVKMLQLARPSVFPVASPDLAERLGRRIGSAGDLAALPLIEEGGDTEWRLWFAAQGVSAPLDTRIARYGHAQLALAAARAGQGIALGNHYLIAEDLAAGRLIALRSLEHPFVPVALGAYVFRAHVNRWDDRPVARFRRWLTDEFNLDPSD